MTQIGISRNWRVKAVLPVAGVLLAGLLVFIWVTLSFEQPERRAVILVAAAGAVAICAVLLVALAVLIQRPLVELQEKIAKLQDGDLTVEAGGDITLKTDTGDLSIEAMNVSIKSQLNIDIEASGGQATLKGSLGATVDGTISSTLQGATISVNGITSFSPA